MSKYPGFYSDIGKKARDVLHKDYAQRPPMHFRYKSLDWSLDLSCQLEETLPGLRSLFECSMPNSGKVELQYSSNYAGITGCIGLLNSEDGYNPVANLSGVIGTSLLSLGGGAAFDISTMTVNKLNAGFGLSAAYLTASLTVHDRFETLKGSCYLEVNPLTRSAIAAEVSHDLSTNAITGVTFGAQHSMFPHTLVKARLDSNGVAGALVQGELWQRFFMTVAVEMDFRCEEKIPKVGFSVALTPW